MKKLKKLKKETVLLLVSVRGSEPEPVAGDPQLPGMTVPGCYPGNPPPRF